jgi:8-oxo-dGTP pyrophosphatase MutT (NUDIX family)
VVAVTESGAFVCFRQVKYAFTEDTLAIVGGYLNGSEDPLDAARRELREETGYESDDWVELGHYRVDPNRGVAVGHLYLARRARLVTTPIVDDLEEQHLLLLTRAEVEGALAAGEFKVLAWTTAVALALRHL